MTDDEMTIHVLHVDDEPMVSEIVESMLTRYSDRFIMTSATTAAEGLSVLSDPTVSIDCIVSDYEMDGMSGLELLHVLRSGGDETPFILFTGHGSEETASDAIAAGVTDYLQKQTGTDHYTVLANRIINAVEQYRTQSRLKQNQQESKAILDLAPMMVFVGQDGRFVYVNDAAVELTAAESQESLLGTAIVEWFHPSDRETIQSNINPVETGERQVRRSKRTLITADDTEVPVAVTSRGITYGGHPSALAIVQDRRAEHEKQAQLKRHREKLSALHTAAEQFMTATNPQMVYDRAIEAAERILAFDICTINIAEGEYLPRKATSTGIPLVRNEPKTVTDGIAGKTYQTGESFLIADLSEEPDAQPTDNFQSALSVPIGGRGVFQAARRGPERFSDADLELAELLAMHVQIAVDRVEHETTLHEQNEQLQQFATAISHDMRNPLSIIQGAVNTATKTDDSSSLAAAGRAADRMDSLIDDILFLTRRGEWVTRRSPVSLQSILTAAWGQTGAQSSATVTFDLPPEMTISADAPRLQQLFENLFANSLEHVGTNCSITVSVTETTISVTDDGDGFPEENVFDLGYSGSETGSGLGLSIVHSIATGHGWDVSIDHSTAGGTVVITDIDSLSVPNAPRDRPS
ncbi:response regulator [Natronocalculus amylovorans]|uniref:histidine kinase n=1 Tax=Natronocalculus amylovorans TaxID=2917812 RepID=A0AAE3FVK5_9EURY|nr:response regulator [Natronocalculus amylovorans]MCL9815955.1 response regulator [Natronocalculus amylovorans]